MIALIQTPHRFRTKRPLWKYSGFAIETHSSADYRKVQGQLERTKKRVSVRGLNRDCNHDLKNLFKSAATIASVKPGPFQEFYAALVAKGMRPEMARLTLARKIATIVLIVWKKVMSFGRQISETTNSLSVSDRVRSIPGIFSWRWPSGSRDTWFESEFPADKLGAACFGHLVSQPTLGPLDNQKAMGHESRIEPWSPNLTTFCFVGFGTDRLQAGCSRSDENRW